LLALSATDAWGNSATTNVTVVQSQLQFSMFDVSPDELFQRAISVGGIVADPGCTIYVNGVPARNNGDGTWSADNVPLTPGATATFTVMAYPAGHDLEESAARQIKPGVEKPPRVYVEEDTRDLDYSRCLRQDVIEGGPWTETHDQMSVGHDWRDGAGGPGWSMRDQHDLSSDPGAEQFNHCEGTIRYPASEWPVLLAGEWNVNPECFAFRYEDNPPIVGMEHCEVHDPTSAHWGPTPVRDIYDPWYGQMTVGSLDWTYNRTAQTTMKLFTGGKATVHRSNLFVVQGSATEVLDKRAVPPLQGGVNSRTIPPEEITVGGLGKLGNDGRRYKVLPDGATKDLTPKTSRKFYTFKVDGTKYYLTLNWNGTDVSDGTSDVLVGQRMTISASLSPQDEGTPAIDSYGWTVGGNVISGMYVSTDEWQREGHPVPLTDLTHAQVSYCYVEGGQSEVQCTVIVKGEKLTGKTTFRVKKPSARLEARIQEGVNVVTDPDMLVFGNYTFAGITFTGRDKDTDGDWQFIQIGHQLFRYQDAATGKWQRKEGTGLDGPYPNPNDQDKPFTQLPAGGSTVTADGSFTTYLAFRPTPSDTLVPIRKVEWSWNGTAEYLDSHWTLVSGTPHIGDRAPSDAAAPATINWTDAIKRTLDIPISEN
jgi:hypothetical protein